MACARNAVCYNHQNVVIVVTRRSQAQCQRVTYHPLIKIPYQPNTLTALSSAKPIPSDGEAPVYVHQQGIDLWPTFNLAHYLKILDWLELNAGGQIELFDYNSLHWIAEDVDTIIDLKHPVILFMRNLGLTDCPQRTELIEQYAPTKKGSGKQPHRSDGKTSTVALDQHFCPAIMCISFSFNCIFTISAVFYTHI